MIGLYVRLVMAPKVRIGTVKAARFENRHVSFVFHQDSRFANSLPDVWVLDSDIKECARPTDEQVAIINNLVKNDS